MGEISPGGTLFLLLAGGVIGVLGGLVFLAVRRWLPGEGWLRGLLFGGFLLSAFGSLIIDPDNRDFVFLDPAALAITTFAAIYLLYGVLFVLLYEWIGPTIIAARRGWVPVALPIVLLIPLVLTGTLAIFLVAAVPVGFAIHRSQPLIRFWSKHSVEYVGYVVLFFLTIFGVTKVAGAIVEIV